MHDLNLPFERFYDLLAPAFLVVPNVMSWQESISCILFCEFCELFSLGAHRRFLKTLINFLLIHFLCSLFLQLCADLDLPRWLNKMLLF